MAKDDDGAGGTDSRVSFTLPADGLYVVRANSLQPKKEGGYTLQAESTGDTAEPSEPVGQN